MKHKFFITLSLLLVLAFMFASCSQPTEVEPTKEDEGDAKAEMTGTFVVAAHNEDEIRANTIRYFFEQNYPNMEVTFDVTPDMTEYFVKLQTQIASGTSPDFILMHETRAKGFAAQGLLLPLDDLYSSNPMELELDSFAGLKAQRYEGKTYVVPITFANYGIVYNKDLFDAAGVDYPTDDWTWDDLLAGAKKISDPEKGIYGYTGFDAPGWIPEWYPLVKSYGGDMFDSDDSKCMLDSAEAIEAFAYMQEAWESGAAVTPATATEFDGGYPMFLEGRAGMAYFYTGYFQHLDENHAGFGYGLTALPSGPEGRFIRIGGSSFAIPFGASHPEIAWELMRWMVGTDEGIRKAYELDNASSANVDYFFEFNKPSEEILTKVPNWREVAIDQASEYGVFVPYSKISTEFTPMIEAEFAFLVDGTYTPEEFASTVCEKANKMFSDFE